MKFTLNQIEKNAHFEPFHFDQELDVSELESMKNDIRKMKPVRVQGEYSMEGDEYIFTLTISGEMILPCARTLVDVSYPFEVNTIEIFSSSQHLTEEELESEIHPVEGYAIDLTPYILENIQLAIPYRVFSDDEKTKDVASLKGEGWELTLEEELDEDDEKQEETIDPRLKKLKSLLDDKQDES